MNKFKHTLIINFIKKFTAIHNRPPTGPEIATEGILSLRQIQRSYGGLISLRKLAGVTPDLRSTPRRALLANQIKKMRTIAQKNFHEKLIATFGSERIKVNLNIIEEKNNYIHFQIKFSETNKILIDLIIPGLKESIPGCVAAKIRKNEVPKYRDEYSALYIVNITHSFNIETHKHPWIKIVNESTFWNNL